MLRLDINLLFTALNILIWFILIRKFLFGPINNLINKREEAIADQYAKARQLQAEAEEERNRCALLEAEIEAKRAKTAADSKEAARAEYDRIVTEAEEKAEHLLAKTRKDLELEKLRIIGKAEKEIRSIIMEAAVNAMPSSASDSALYDQFLTKAGGQNGD